MNTYMCTYMCTCTHICTHVHVCIIVIVTFMSDDLIHQHSSLTIGQEMYSTVSMVTRDSPIRHEISYHTIVSRVIKYYHKQSATAITLATQTHRSSTRIIATITTTCIHVFVHDKLVDMVCKSN